LDLLVYEIASSTFTIYVFFFFGDFFFFDLLFVDRFSSSEISYSTFNGMDSSFISALFFFFGVFPLFFFLGVFAFLSLLDLEVRLGSSF